MKCPVETELKNLYLEAFHAGLQCTLVEKFAKFHTFTDNVKVLYAS